MSCLYSTMPTGHGKHNPFATIQAAPPFLAVAAFSCQFTGIPGTYAIERWEDLCELVHDPMGFAADLAGLSRAEYLRRLAGEASL